MAWLTAPENDYRSLIVEGPDPVPKLKVSVVMPVYNRVDLLARTVAGLVTQSYPRHLWDVIVADDGSDEDVEAALAALRDRLPVTVVRRDHDGYGAGQARNLGARTSSADLLVFIDGDCLPDPDLISRHAAWHHKADNLVTIGSRHGADTSDLSLEQIADGAADLKDISFGTKQVSSEQLAPTDFRGVLHRRTAGMRHGEEAYRSLVSSNFAVRRDRFLELGGFCEEFHRWGGEDTELGWRLYMGGLFFVPEDGALCYHQLQEDAWGETGREESKALNAGIIQNKIPHPFYRKHQRGHLWEVPRVSWIVLPARERPFGELWEQLLTHQTTDWEALHLDDGSGASLLAEQNAADPRFRLIPPEHDIESQFLSAVRAARGEYIAIIHGWAALEPSLLSKALRRLERAPRFGRVTAGYQIMSGDEVERHLRLDDVVALDQAWGFGGLPAFTLVRRRDWNKAIHESDRIPAVWERVQELTKAVHLSEPLVGLPSAHPDGPLPSTLPPLVGDTRRLIEDLRRVGASPDSIRKVASFAGAKARRRPYGGGWPTKATRPPSIAGEPVTGPIAVRYVGWAGHENLGDEALLAAVTGLMPWADIKTSTAGKLLLLGGGTLINRSDYLTWLQSQDSPRVERAVFGTGVANPEYWGLNEDPADWVDFLETCAYVGVRGPRSEKILRGWGYRGQLEVVGDPALHLTALRPAERIAGRVVISPAWTKGELWGKDDRAVFETLASYTRALLAESREVHFLSCFPADDRHIIKIMRDAGAPDLPYLAGYESLQASLELLGSADLVVAERLHAAVLAAAVDTPFTGLEYRPKLRDFAESVGMERFVIRTDVLTVAELLEATGTIERERSSIIGGLGDATARYRTRLRAASNRLEEVMRT